MRIKGFSYLAEEHLEPHILNTSTVVVDGHNLFYTMYKSSRLPFVLGAESDLFASYIKSYLEMFIKADVTCHFLMKGGHKNTEKLEIHFEMGTRLSGKDFELAQDYGDRIINPLFVKQIFLQVLNEMNFEYTICYTNDIVDECTTLAQKLSCPVISYNIQYCFSGVPYIPLKPGTKFECDENNNLKCGKFKLDKLLKDYNITMEKMILFMLLTDIHIFDENTFNDFFKSARIRLSLKYRYKNLLNWLRYRSEKQALWEIFKHISESDKIKFCEQKLVIENKISMHEEAESMAVLYFIDKNRVQIDKSDPLWLEKGICLHYVDITYINLYKYGIVQASNYIEDSEAENSVLLSIDIIKYIYDLLTNFKGSPILVYNKGDDISETQEPLMTYEQSVRKPEYDANFCVFENGWNDIKSLRLFEHFLTETFGSFNFETVDRAPADSRLLLIAMVYFTRKKSLDVTAEIYSIMLSYVMLSVVAGKVDIHKIGNTSNIADQPIKPILDSATDKDSVSAQDCEIVSSIMGKYFKINNFELNEIFDRKIVHPLVEFQQCLKELNRLNTLCGSPFPPTVYSKTYNGTFVYKVLFDIKESDCLEFIRSKLKPAATALAFTTGMIELYEKI